MFNIKHHVFVCINQRPAGHPKGCCASKGSRDILQRFQEELERRQLFGSMMVNGSTCLGPCDAGPTVVIYPEGTWYGQVKADDIKDIIEQHLIGGKPVERLLLSNLVTTMGG